MSHMLPRSQALSQILGLLAEYVERIGISQASTCLGVSTDTVRRRLRGEQPWFLTEMLDLAYHQWQREERADLVLAITRILTPRKGDTRPLRLPSDLRHLLRVVGRLTIEIAITLEDGRVDKEEATRLISLLHDLDPLTNILRENLQALLESF